MSNILKISTPVSTGENAIRKQDPQLQEKLIKNPVNPDKVVRADSRAEYGNERGVRQEISYESNFGNFVQTLGSMSKVGDIMSKMLFSGMANLIEAGISQGTAEEIQTLLQLLEIGRASCRERVSFCV